MPTRYTEFIENKQCNSVKQFLKLCLRNFGVLSKYKDEPLSLDFEPDFTDENVNSFIKNNENRIEKYKKELEEYDNLSYDEKASKIKEDCLKELNFYKNIYDKSVKLNTKYDNFIEAINGWDCSKDFNSIKEFAINQCEISKENLDYYEKEIIKYQKLLNKIETSKYEVQCEIDKHRNAIIANIKSCQDYINRIKEQNNKYESNKEFYDRFVKEIENIKFKI